MVYAFSIALLVNAGSFSHNHGRYQGIGTCGIRYSGIWQVLMADAARLAESVVRYALLDNTPSLFSVFRRVEPLACLSRGILFPPYFGASLGVG